uniref:Translation initiation factor IF-2 subunit alpha n=1 Tax=Ignisphaera aggregans TaxID=334771 RepID=A0A832EMK1_9CREN
MSVIPFRKKGLPEVGELVIARIDKVFEYGAYATLLEYEAQEAFIPWSEVSTRYVKDIRDVLKEGRVVVGKVIRVDKKVPKVQVDISIKRVLEGEKRIKILRWKRLQRAQKIVELAAKNIKKNLNDTYSEVWSKLEKDIDPMSILEQCILEGPEVLIRKGIPGYWSTAICEEAKKHISIKMVKIRAIMKIASYKSDGIERIKKILTSIYNIELPQNTKIYVYTIGSPRYRIEIMAPHYKDAEKIFNHVNIMLHNLVKELEIDQFEIEREEIEKGG